MDGVRIINIYQDLKYGTVGFTYEHRSPETHKLIACYVHKEDYDTIATENKKLREELEQDNQFLSKQNKMLEKAIESARIEKGNLEQELTSTKSKIAEVNAENDRLFNRLSDFAFEHPLYKLSKELEKENKELEDELRVTKSQLDEAVELLYGLQNEFEGSRAIRCDKVVLILGEYYDTHIGEFLAKVKV